MQRGTDNQQRHSSSRKPYYLELILNLDPDVHGQIEVLGGQVHSGEPSVRAADRDHPDRRPGAGARHRAPRVKDPLLPLHRRRPLLSLTQLLVQQHHHCLHKVNRKNFILNIVFYEDFKIFTNPYLIQTSHH